MNGIAMTAKFPGLALLALLLVAAAPQQAAAIAANERSYAFSESGAALFNAGDYAAAVIQLKNALQQDPRNPAARVLLGRAYLRLGDAAFAERELLHARRIGAHPNLILVPLGRAYLLQRKYAELLEQIRPARRGSHIEASVHDIRGRAYMALRNFDKAEAEFAEAALHQPGAAFPLLGQARAKILRGRLDEAKALVGRAITLEPESSDAWYEKADIERAEGNVAAALESYAEAIKRQPNNIPARLGRAAILVQLQRDSEAMEDIDFVRQNAPREMRAAYLQSQILMRQGNAKEAQAILADAEQVLKKRDPNFVRNHPPSLLLLGVIGHARNNFEDAYHYLSRYVELDPNHPGARKLLGGMLLRKGNAWAAIDTLRPALHFAPADTGILTLLGTAYMRIGEFEEASRLLEKAAATAPDRAGIRTQLGISRIGLGQTDKAEADFETAIALESDGSRPDLLLGLLHLKRGDYDKALLAAEKIAESDPLNPFAYNLAGAAEMGKGNLKSARTKFEAALDLQPAYSPAFFNLARLDMAEGNAEAAKARYATLLELRPKDVKAMDALAAVALSEGKLDEAIKWLQQITVLKPDAIDPHIRIIEIQLRQQRIESALSMAESLELAHPTDVLVLETLGRVLLVTRKFSTAAEKFRRLAELSSEDPDKLTSIALLQEEARDIAGARETFRRAVTLNPKNLRAQVALIQFEAREKNFENALSLARALRETHPDYKATDLILGELLIADRRFQEAAEVLTAAFAENPSSQIVKQLYSAKHQQGRANEGLKLLLDWIAEHPDDIAVRRLLASAYLHNGQIDDAIAATEKLLARLPEDPALLNNLAGMYHKKGDPRALTYAEKAYRMRPQHPATLDTYGWILVHNEQPERGLELLRQAFTRAADNPEIRYHLAVALARTGRDEEAREELTRALDSGTRFNGENDARALLQKLRGG